MQNKLQVIKNADELLKKDKISTFEETIIKKAEEYKKFFNEDELQNITETIKKYKSWKLFRENYGSAKKLGGLDF